MKMRWKATALFALLAAVSHPIPAIAQVAPTAQGAAVETEVKMKPKILEAHEGAFQSDAAPTLLVGRSLIKTGPSAVSPLLERLQQPTGTSASLTPPGAKLPETPFILIGLEHDHPALHKLVADHHTQLPKHGMGPEGYLLEVTPAHVLIVASKPAGAFYGVRKLLEMDATPTSHLTVPAGTVVDWPEMGWRGMHLLVGSREELPLLEKLLTDYLPRYRLNRLILEINYHFKFKSHPEAAEGDALTPEDCHHLKELADQHFIELTPMINCLGHQSWAQNTAQLLKTHPEFDETPDVPADNKGIYCRSWCPNHPDVAKFVCDLIDEMVDAFDAKSFHVGMDEVFLLGKCSRCKDTPNAKLFAKAVNDLHAHIVGKRKLLMMMWGDRLLDGKTTGYGEWEASEVDTAPAIDLIPKDIVLCDWHYETKYAGQPATYPSVHYFQDKGLRVWPSSWNSEDNARMLADVSLKNRTDRMVGYLSTTWIGVTGVARGLAGDLSGDANQRSEDRASGVVAALRTGSRIAWEGDGN